MASVAEVLSAEQGLYQWRTRDCLTTAARLVNARVGARRAEGYLHAIMTYHRLREPRAWAECIARGGPLAVHREALGTAAEEIDFIEPGCLVFFDEPIRTRNHCELDASPGREQIGFAGEDGFVWHWTTMGLSPVVNEPHVAAVLRAV